MLLSGEERVIDWVCCCCCEKKFAICLREESEEEGGDLFVRRGEGDAICVSQRRE